MARNSENGGAHALDEANRCESASWHPCRYTARSRVLVLCGEYPEGGTAGYLVFRRPHRAELPSWIDRAVFRLAPPESQEGASGFGASDAAVQLITVLIHAQPRDLRIVCESVGFHAAPLSKGGE